MCKMIKDLEAIADNIIQKEHKVIDKPMTDKERMIFVNASATIQEHSNFIQRTLSP